MSTTIQAEITHAFRKTVKSDQEHEDSLNYLARAIFSDDPKDRVRVLVWTGNGGTGRSVKARLLKSAFKGLVKFDDPKLCPISVLNLESESGSGSESSSGSDSERARADYSNYKIVIVDCSRKKLDLAAVKQLTRDNHQLDKKGNQKGLRCCLLLLMHPDADLKKEFEEEARFDNFITYHPYNLAEDPEGPALCDKFRTEPYARQFRIMMEDRFKKL